MNRHGKPAILRTRRLYLREFDPRDAAALYALNSDPEVMRYTGDVAFASAAAAEAFVRDYDHYRNHRFGRWAVVLERNHRFIGWSGLQKDETTGEVDLGFRLFTQYWAQGYATEAGKAALQVGFERYGLDRIIARSMRENLPSVTVLRKLGMEFCEVREESEVLWLIYAIDRDSWLALTSTGNPTAP